MDAARSGSPGLDLDVLQLFAALMETGALHRAATRLDISQPMASRELNRMRAIFNDKLFIKAGAGMVPTARAVELQPAIADVLARMEAIVTPERFDPAASRQLFRIAVADNGFLFFIGRVVPQLTRHSPHVRLEVRQIDAEIFAQLREGQLDAAIFPAQKLPPITTSGNCSRAITFACSGVTILSCWQRHRGPRRRPRNSTATAASRTR